MKFSFLRGFPDGPSLALLWAFAKFAGVANGLYCVQKVEVLGKHTRNKKRRLFQSTTFRPVSSLISDFPFHGRSLTSFQCRGIFEKYPRNSTFPKPLNTPEAMKKLGSYYTKFLHRFSVLKRPALPILFMVNLRKHCSTVA